MRENDVRKLFEPFALDEEKKEELWTQISNRGEQTEAEDGSLIVSKQRRLRGWHRAVAAAAIVLLLWGAGAAVNAATPEETWQSRSGSGSDRLLIHRPNRISWKRR